MIIGVPKEIKLQEHRIGLTPDSVKILNEKGHKIFELESNDIKYKFEYDFNWHKQKIHNIKPQYNGDALEKMLTNVLYGTVDFNLNLQRSLLL